MSPQSDRLNVEENPIDGFMSGRSSARHRRAMLIGIDTYPHVPQLDGCVNDVQLMRSVLVATFGFAPDDISLLTNDQATRDAILSAFDALIAVTGTDDIVVIHYAGHGSRMTDREGDEPSGFDSTILPFDSGRAPQENRDITDDEIQLKLEALGAKTSYATLIVDACHSGTITRDVFGEKARGVPADRRSDVELPPSPIPHHMRKRPQSAGPSGWMPIAEKYLLIAGCRDDEMSYEYRPPEATGAVAHGALTYFLCEYLRQAVPGTSYRDVFESAAARVNAEHGAQHPQMEGQADREIFGVADLTPIAFVQVTARQESTVTIGAGVAHGLTVGSTYAMFPPRTKAPDRGDSIGDVKIAAVGVVTADAEVVGEIVAGGIAPGARGFETAHAFGDFRLPVQCVENDGFAAAFSGLHDRLRMSALLKVVSEDAVAAARVYLLGPRSKVTPAVPVPQAGVLDAPRWAVVSATGDLLMPLKMLGDESEVVENLATIARYRQALALENPDPQSQLRGRFSLDLLRLERDGSWSVARPGSDGGHIVLDEGEAIAFRIESRHDEPVYISLLDFGLSGVIAQVFPPRNAQDQLAPGVTFEIGTTSTVPVRLMWPAGHPFVSAAAHPREVEGRETVKLFITEQPADFFALEQQGVRSTWSSSPLTLLLRGAFHGLATRDIAMSPTGAEDWTTVSRSFVLRRKTSVPLPPDGAPIVVGTATVSAPGLSGTVDAGFGNKGRDKADRLITAALRRALFASGVETRQTIEIAGAQERGPATRTAGDRPAFELRLPDPGAGLGQMVIAVDELGVFSWCFAAPDSNRPATRGFERPTHARTYRIPRSVPAETSTADATRGLVGVVGKKILMELVFPLLDPVLGPVSESFVNRLEHQRWPYRVRSFTPDDYARDEAVALDRDGWSRLASGRALLMVHGAFSRTHLAFAQLSTDCVQSLNQLYGGRVYAFDHVALSDDPRENVRRLVSAMPETADVTLDIVAHSRGGLVGRWLSEKQSEISLGARRLRIGKVVFVGAPSAGTALADPEHVGDVLDVFTNLMNFLPDNGVVDVMTMIVEVAKQVAVGALGGLDGLRAMRPGGGFARQMNAGARSGDVKYFAVASSVTPSDPGLRHFAVTRGLNQLLQGPNDFVVPTQGVFAANGSGFFPIEERLLLEGALGVAHTRYFESPAVRGAILKWLAAEN